MRQTSCDGSGGRRCLEVPTQVQVCHWRLPAVLRISGTHPEPRCAQAPPLRQQPTHLKR